MKKAVKTNVPHVVTLAVRRAVATLDSISGYGVTYRVTSHDGTQFTNETIKPADLIPPISKRKCGLISMYKPVVSGMKAGDVKLIPVNGVAYKRIASAVSAWCYNNWGKGAAITHVNRKAKAIEVMRVS